MGSLSLALRPTPPLSLALALSVSFYFSICSHARTQPRNRACKHALFFLESEFHLDLWRTWFLLRLAQRERNGRRRGERVSGGSERGREREGVGYATQCYLLLQQEAEFTYKTHKYTPARLLPNPEGILFAYGVVYSCISLECHH